jgi:hypothetical protein
MTDYGKGAVLGAAAVLPATSAVELAMTNSVNPAIVDGFLAINFIWLLVLTAHISRYFVNRSK